MDPLDDGEELVTELLGVDGATTFLGGDAHHAGDDSRSAANMGRHGLRVRLSGGGFELSDGPRGGARGGVLARVAEHARRKHKVKTSGDTIRSYLRSTLRRV
ncbi:MAG: hypothetical protein ACRD12_12665 [Acidimicrobiales bacterium]